MAGDVAAKARQLGFAEVHVVSFGDSPLADPTKTAEIAAGSNFFLIFVATYNGETPDSALSFSDLLDAEIKAGNSSRFAGINFCVFGAGNTQWGPTFQAFPNDANLAALGGNRIFEKGTGDSNGDQDAHFTQWTTRLWAATAANFGVEFVPHPPPSSAEPFVSQPPIPGFVGATLRANIELVDEDTPMPRGMRLLNFDELLLYYADLVEPLHRSGLMVLFSFLPDSEKFKDLRETLSAAGAAPDKAKSFTKKNSNFSELIANYPSLAQVLDLQKLLVVLRATQLDSPLADPRVAKLCVGVENSRATDHQGLCSSFLARAQVGHVVWVRARSAQESFHLSNDPAIPVIMVAAGTGISAFLGFLAQGIKVQEHGGQAPVCLFYGTSYHDMPSLRRHVFADDGTVLVEAAYSEEDSPRRFAQHILIRDALKIWSDLSNNGRVYVCGSATRVGEGVRQALTQIAVQVGGVVDPAAWFAGVKKEGRYGEDVFG
ncbi:hypothetical protein DFH08DRAFT_976020 [Mycena albidolilacea]|uniref:NADPH--hemoprotein reductase n=1 Tax=Mycena albidolilacea TaxID=1033008 RepID=A0AAD6Z4M9_9AGAR|nr:hypothetical protein DFH08DRAFT_976020 [Mycena albidolilacea]